MAWKTHRTTFCPHCGKPVKYSVTQGGEDYAIRIGNPISFCPYCGKPYKDEKINEWLFISPDDRENYLCFGEKGFDKVGMWVWISIPSIFLLIAVICSANGNHAMWIGFVIFVVLALLFYVIPYFVHKNSNKEHRYNNVILDSIDRCCDVDYLKVMKASGYKLYTINTYELNLNKVKEKYDAILEIWNSLDDTSKNEIQHGDSKVSVRKA